MTTTAKAKDPVQRQIFLHERGLKNAQKEISDIRREAAERIAKIEARMRVRKVLLSALRNGKLRG